MTEPVVQLIGNPTSGSYSAALIGKLRAEFERQGARVSLGESRPGTALVIDESVQRVCVVGGDGTLRHVAAAIRATGRAVPMVPYPAGTVNLMQREIALPTSLAAFVRKALSDAPPRAHYSARVNDTLFLATASVAPDGDAVDGLSPRLKRRIGRLAYVVAMIAVLWRWPRRALQLTIDGVAQSCEAFYVAKGRYFAGRWSFAPDARMDGPFLDVVTIRTLTRWTYLRFVVAMLLGRPVGRVPGVETFRCTELVASVRGGDASPAPMQGDGDTITRLPVHVRVDPEPIYVVR